MKCALIAMPWARTDMPSTALGLLAAVARRDRPQHQLECLHPCVEIGVQLGATYRWIASDDRMGELLYASLLHPEKIEPTRARFSAWLAERGHDPSSIPPILDHVFDVLTEQAEALARQIAAGGYDLLGFTTSYNQLFPSLMVARRVRQLDPRPRILLGGMGVADAIGPSVIEHFPFVDYVIQGEGERRLLALLDRLEHAPPSTPTPGLLTRDDDAADAPPQLATRDELSDLGWLPVPDYDDYEQLAERHGLRWSVPVEGSRGCWWDRVKRTGNAMDTCYFCSLNTTSYRDKTPARIADEIETLSDRYQNVSFHFLDNIIRARGVDELASRLIEHGRSYRFFYEIRAQISSYELLRLREAGCCEVQIGIEGLSSTYLRRIGKGTTAIQNLAAMRACYELGISSASNLLVNFPGATEQEVEQTCETILGYAIAYQPADIASFVVYPNCSVAVHPERFGVTSMASSEDFRAALPDELWRTLELFWNDATYAAPLVDWRPVQQACKTWRQLHRALGARGGDQWFQGLRTLCYRDGGSFLEIIDRRSLLEREGHDAITIGSPAREIYLECMEPRAESAVLREYAPTHGQSRVRRIIESFLADRLMFRERGRLLALAVADDPQAAARRIRARHRDRAADRGPPSPRRVSLPVA